MKPSPTPRTTLPSNAVHLKSILLGIGLLSAGVNAQALVVTSLAGSFAFGPDDLNFTQGASLASYSGPGTLLGVRVELSGNAFCDLFVTNARDTEGTVISLMQNVSFSIAGLPQASLMVAPSTFSAPPFTIAAMTTVHFLVPHTFPLVAVDLSSAFDVAFYDFSQGAPALLPFQFSTTESFELNKIGSGISGGSLASASGLVNVYYTVDTDPLVPPVPVPEVSTAVSAGCFAFLGALVLLRFRRLSRPQNISEVAKTSDKSSSSVR